MNFNQWAIKWGIPFEAVEDLRREMGAISTEPDTMQSDKPESMVQTSVRPEASKKGLRLWRNNVGVAMDENGVRNVRYGLCNESKKMNKLVKSSDLVGIRPVLITSEMVGSIIGQFVARECKPSKWQYTETAREKSQLNFLNIVLSLGGDAAFANNEGTL